MKSEVGGPIAVLATVLITLAAVGIGLHYSLQPLLNQGHIDPGLDWVAEDGDPAQGNMFFQANCASCHQEDGHGIPGLAPSIRNRDFLALASDGFIRETIRKGRPGTAMIPRPNVSDQKIADVVAFLRSVEVANPVNIQVDHDRVIEGDFHAGRRTYERYCASCHGPHGEGYAAGGSGPGIGTPGFIAMASDDYIYQTIKRGRVGTPMMPFMGPGGLVNLSEGEVHNVIAFLKVNSHSEYFRGGRQGKTGPPDPAHGAMLFAQNCANCHMEGGVGKPGLAPSIRNRDFLALATNPFITETVTNGRPGTAMVARPDLEQELPHIIAYLRSLPVANPVEVTLDSAFVAEGDPAEGRHKFKTFCASCHGSDGQGYSAGGSGPGIGLPGFLDVANDDYILQTTKRGRMGTAMMPVVGPQGLANLTESDIEDIIVYLRNKKQPTPETGGEE